jgi:hypothetical protein
LLYRGYPNKNDRARVIELPYKGFEVKTIIHPEFGDKPVKVYAIKIIKDVPCPK